MKVPQSLRDLMDGAESLVYIEDLSDKHGLLQAINPLAKLVVIVFMIVASLFISSPLYLALICIVPIVLALSSRIPLQYFASRTFFIPVFAAIISLPILFLASGYAIAQMHLGSLVLTITSEGIQRMVVFSLRVWFCVASLVLLVLSTGFDNLLKLLSSLRVPPVIVQLFSLTYRYFFVSVHEAQSVLIAKEARTYIHRRSINYQALKDLGSILSTLFIRTYERSERVYMAMKSRGFELDNKTKLSVPPFRLRDFLFAVSIFITFGLLVLAL
jgi:cobalt/nickel transport system permease protein